MTITRLDRGTVALVAAILLAIGIAGAPSQPGSHGTAVAHTHAFI
jgi:hypothetical protein